MSQAQLYQWAAQIRSHMRHLTKPQALVLAAFSLGIALSRRCTLSLVAETLGALGKADTVERRLQRWIANARIDVPVSLGFWARWVLGSLIEGPVFLLVDETKLGPWLGVMVVGVAYRRRCIPLAWRCYRPDAYPPEGQVQLIAALLHRVQPALPAGCQPVVEADRGIGTSPALVRMVMTLGWYYLFRVQGTTRMRTADGPEMALRDKVRRGKHWSGVGQVFKDAGWLETHIHLIWKRRYDQPWCLITNAPHLTGRAYAYRAWQEQSFRDLKRGGWHWNRSQVRLPDHADRLVLILAVAYAWVLTLGTIVIRTRALRRHLTRGRRRTYSVFRLGLRYLSHLTYARLPVCFGLLFIPYQPFG
ncbi:MAG: hypothetical protein Kow00106_25320 [Anaerolineae bacterium]